MKLSHAGPLLPFQPGRPIGNIYYGACSWTDRTLIDAGTFYPGNARTAADRLAHYASQFPIVEVDATYYALPSERNAHLWADRTPPGFVFNIKAFGLFTHHPVVVERLPAAVKELLPAAIAEKSRVYLRDIPEQAEKLIWEMQAQALAPLVAAGKLGCVLFQFPHWFTARRAHIRYLEQLRNRSDWPLAIEFRGGGWMTDNYRARTFALLEKLGLAYVVVDEPQGFRSSTPPVVAATNALALVRFHGHNAETYEKPNITAAERFRYLYTEDELKGWVEPIRRLAENADRVHVLMNNCYGDYGLRLPEGYYRDRGDKDKGGQQTLYERAQEAATGLSKDERMAQVTQAWRSSDSPKAFVRALEDLGYVLATGKRPYVLVDVYGEVNALPKLIDDKSVRTKDIRAFLEGEFPPEALPSVEEAQALIAQHRQAIEDLNKARAKADELEQLKARQAQRRAGAERDAVDLKARQGRERKDLLQRQARERSALRAAYLDEMKRRRMERARHSPKGLAAFLGRVTGVALVTKKLHKYRDRKRFEALLADRQRLKDRQGQERLTLRRAQSLEAADVARKLRALDRVEQREHRSLETVQLKQMRIDERCRHDHQMPPVRTRSRDAAKPRRVTSSYTSTFARELAERAHARKRVVTDVNLRGDFEHVAGQGDAETSGDSGKASQVRRTIHDHRAAKRRVVTEVNLQGDFEHAATHQNTHTGEDTSSSDGPKLFISPTQKPPRPRRPRGRKWGKDFDREM